VKRCHNPKYKLDKDALGELLAIINGDHTNKEKENYIRQLQSKNIGIKNPRTQRLGKLEEDKLIFIRFYNDIVKVLKLRDYPTAVKTLSMPPAAFISLLSLNCGAISADGLLLEKFELPKSLSQQWVPFARVMQKLVADENPKERRRFRRLIPPERMVRLSEMLYALTNPEKYANFKL
jgi:hypothetical protein